MAKANAVAVKQPQPQPQTQPAALARVYMDIPAAMHHQLKVIALSKGITLKALMESLAAEAALEYAAKEADTLKRTAIKGKK